MALLYIAEYEDIPSAYASAAMQVVRDPPSHEQVPLAIGVSSVPSLPFGSRTRIVRLHCDAVCSILIGPSGSTTATANNQRMAANQTEYKLVVPGYIVSVITNS
jgi:type IV secretory pathway TrbL component